MQTTPDEQAAGLCRHFRAERVDFVGGHVLQFGRGQAFGAILRRMGALGLLRPRDETAWTAAAAEPMS